MSPYSKVFFPMVVGGEAVRPGECSLGEEQLCCVPLYVAAGGCSTSSDSGGACGSASCRTYVEPPMAQGMASLTSVWISPASLPSYSSSRN